MRYFFTWNSNFLIKEWIKKWKNQFISKYWDFNMIYIQDIDTYDNNFLAENFLSGSFLAEKKLIIIQIDKNIWDDKLLFFEKNLDKIPEETWVLIGLINPDKRSKIYKLLKQNFETKEFNIQNENDVIWIIQNKYSNSIEPSAIKKIAQYKSNNIEKIFQEIDKLLINFEKVDSNIISKYIEPELEESIFIIIDDILNLHIWEAIKKINNLINYTNVYAFYNNLLANIRINVFISELKTKKLNNNDISKILNLWNRAFLINKNYRISNHKLKNFYLWLIEIDKNMKTWKLLWSDDKDILLEIEKELIKVY